MRVMQVISAMRYPRPCHPPLRAGTTLSRQAHALINCLTITKCEAVADATLRESAPPFRLSSPLTLASALPLFCFAIQMFKVHHSLLLYFYSFDFMAI